MITVLDKGFVKVIDHMGGDISATKAARASFAKDSPEWNAKEEKLLAFLIREKHMSCFRHATITYQVKAPLFVVNQWYKYSIASTHRSEQFGWNEMSKRYVTAEPEFYIPENNAWRSMPANKKQGSGVPLSPQIGAYLSKTLAEFCANGQELYQAAEEMGVATEQARLFIPAYAMYTQFQWTTSLATVMHFLQERLAHDAQAEIRQYAAAVLELTTPLFPATFKLLGLGE